MAKILNVLPHDDYTLTIELDNHHKIIYDMKPRLQSLRFCELMDQERFAAVHIEYDKVLVWDNHCQMTIDEIFSRVER